MTATIETLHKDGNEIYPTTVADAVVDEDNHTVQQRIDSGVFLKDGGTASELQPYITNDMIISNTITVSKIAMQGIFDAIYPVGAIYISVDSANPSTKFGGTWVAWGQGRVPVGVDTAQTEFDTVEETGGQKNHRHDFKIGFTQYYGAFVGDNLDNQGAYKFSTNSYPSTTTSDGNITISRNNVSTNMTQNYSERIRSSIGDTDLGSSLQPYITCYMWKRTA